MLSSSPRAGDAAAAGGGGWLSGVSAMELEGMKEAGDDAGAPSTSGKPGVLRDRLCT